MITISIKRIHRRIRSGIIQNRIGAGKIIYFEIPEEIAFKYIPVNLVNLENTMQSTWSE